MFKIDVCFLVFFSFNISRPLGLDSQKKQKNTPAIRKNSLKKEKKRKTKQHRNRCLKTIRPIQIPIKVFDPNQSTKMEKENQDPKLTQQKYTIQTNQRGWKRKSRHKTTQQKYTIQTNQRGTRNYTTKIYDPNQSTRMKKKIKIQNYITKIYDPNQSTRMKKKIQIQKLHNIPWCCRHGMDLSIPCLLVQCEPVRSARRWRWTASSSSWFLGFFFSPTLFSSSLSLSLLFSFWLRATPFR